jgi:hypothetical protein
MIRTFMKSALALIVTGFLAAPAFAGPGPEDDKTQQKLDDIKQRLEDFLRDQKLMGVDLKKLQDDHADFKKQTVDEITRLNQKIDELQKKLDTMSGSTSARKSYTIDPTMGRLNLRNLWDYTVTFNVNGTLYVVPPQQNRAIDVPAGSVSYEIIGDGYGVIQPMRSITVAGGQAWTMDVFRR